MTDRLTGAEVQEQLLMETRRLRQAAEGIRVLLSIVFIIGFLAAIIWFGVALSS